MIGKTTKLPFNPLAWPSSPHDFTGDDNLGIYAEETTPRYICGTRYTTWDGRVFKYSRAIAAVLATYGADNNAGIINMNVALNQSTVAGDRKVSWLLDSGAGYGADGTVAEDELIGAYIIMGHGATNARMNRMIIANEGGISGEAIELTLDGPCSDAATTPFTEILLNPYRYTSRNVNGSYCSKVCVPAVNCDANEYYWGQTWGPCFLTPGGASAKVGDAEEGRSLYFVGDGSVNSAVDITIENGYQLAGFVLDESVAAGSAAPFAMLQISI